MLVAAATMVSFTSCNKDDKDDATAPEAEYIFAGTTDHGASSFALVLSTGEAGNLFAFTSVEDGITAVYSGEFSFSGNKLILKYDNGAIEELTADVDITSKGLKKVKSLTYDLGDGTVRLDKED